MAAVNNQQHKVNQTQFVTSNNSRLASTNHDMTNKENSALDLMGLGGQDQLDGFEEYEDESSVRVKDTTFQSDALQKTLFMNLGGQ